MAWQLRDHKKETQCTALQPLVFAKKKKIAIINLAFYMYTYTAMYKKKS